MASTRSSAAPLAALYVLLVAYASLYPLDSWRWPPGVPFHEMLRLPIPRWTDRFDDTANLLGYLPLGALVVAATARGGLRPGMALLAGVAAPAALSYLLEVTQQCVPERVPSARDWALNATGALVGSAVAYLAHAAGLFERWQALRERWFVPGSTAAIVLLVLWPVGLLFPAPVPLGMGQVFDALRALIESAVEGTPWAAGVASWLAGTGSHQAPLKPLREGLAIALGLLAPCLLAICVTRPGWRRVTMVAGASVLAVAGTALSTALGFGPEHALAWITPPTLPALALGTAAAVVFTAARARLAAALGLVVLTALVAIVAEAPADPYYAASLQAWERGRFIRFHGLAQWVGWLWPYAAMAWLVARVSRSEQAGGGP
jgi:VanZ family protein